MSSITILKDKCVGCKMCANTCPFGAIEIENKKAVIKDNCTLCGSCVSVCKFNAIELKKDAVKTIDISSYKGIFVFAEHKNGVIENVVFELLGKATDLSKDLNTKVSAIILGENLDKSCKDLIAYGADFVYCIDDSKFFNYSDENYSFVISKLIEDNKPEIVLLGATPYGRSLAPRIASKLNTGLTADCTILEIDSKEKLLQQTRPAFGGNLMATIVCPNHRPQMATVRSKIMKALKPDYSRKGEIINCTNFNLPKCKTHILDICQFPSENLHLEDAEVIVAVGRGIGDSSNMNLVKELASLLDAKIGASRAAVDEGIIDYSHQIGQTGKTVSPKFYFALGISGAIQHIAGISSSDIIIAINKDPDAPIFKIANYGLVGTIEDLLPRIIKNLKEKSL
ncbi:electron transfer flavoprotein subunit alpha/FixB family protein [Clostridium massiliodielmoense]|uniref:electron transfer flavoprotein subunit alpha/FixB family protein n=1 Tax=Clostridium massiliodielmoense TaxID=1776385 RepID=UPI000A267069|nr:electron transfer flavoprotein subunit alpha/FixB family protein [Clostridium massiliodielmoense]